MSNIHVPACCSIFKTDVVLYIKIGVVLYIGQHNGWLIVKILDDLRMYFRPNSK